MAVEVEATMAAQSRDGSEADNSRSGPPPGPLVVDEATGRRYAYYPLGEHVARAPGVCGGRPTIKHTRIDALYVWGSLQRGQTLEEITRAFGGNVSREAVEEVERLVRRYGTWFLTRSEQVDPARRSSSTSTLHSPVEA